jgi:hypothetical protein
MLVRILSHVLQEVVNPSQVKFQRPGAFFSLTTFGGVCSTVYLPRFFLVPVQNMYHVVPANGSLLRWSGAASAWHQSERVMR